MADYCSFKGKDCEISSISNQKICTKGDEVWCAKADCIKQKAEANKKDNVILIEEKREACHGSDDFEQGGRECNQKLRLRQNRMHFLL